MRCDVRANGRIGRIQHGARRRTFAAALLSCAVFAVACGGGGGPPVRVTIPSGSGLRVISDSLARTGVVRSARLFRADGSIRGGGRDMKAGTYMLRRGESWSSVIAALRGGKGLVHVVTVPEGY